MAREHYPGIAPLFHYPGADFAERAAAVQRLLDAEYPEAGDHLRPFTVAVAAHEQRELEELYTRSFDVQSVTTLDVGYVVFGDDYKRGELLSHLNQEYATAGVDAGTELADHLPNLLHLLPAMADEELLQELLQEIVYPALNKMIAEFEPERVAKRNALYEKHYKTLIEQSDQATIYRHTLMAIRAVFEADFPLAGSVAHITANDFLRTVNTELTVEQFGNP